LARAYYCIMFALRRTTWRRQTSSPISLRVTADYDPSDMEYPEIAAL
jgi:hypothetical protein